MHIRNDKPSGGPFVHLHPNANWILNIDFARVLFLSGPSGCGKTQWAAHQFDNPLFIRQLDQLKEFKPGYHDGIIFDDMSFNHMPLESCIHLLDWDMPSAIHCRHTNAFIPAKTRKIFTTNKTLFEAFPSDPHGALRRRISVVYVIKPGERLYELPEQSVSETEASSQEIPLQETGASYADTFQPYSQESQPLAQTRSPATPPPELETIGVDLQFLEDVCRDLDL
jgi:hypothetical protein